MLNFKSFILALGLLCFSCSIAFAQNSIYEVDVHIDVTDVNAAQARDKAMRAAYRQAFGSVVQKLTTSQDAANLEKMTDEQIVNFVREVAVQSEKVSDVRYVADLKVTINDDVLKTYLQEKEIFTILPEKSKIVIIPLFREFETDQPLLWEDNNIWLQTWLQQPIADNMVEIVPIPVNAISQAEISAEQAQVFDAAALQEVALNNNAQDVFVADAVLDGIEGLKISLSSLKSGQNIDVIQIAGDRKMPEPLLNEGVSQVKRLIESKVKTANIAQSRMQSTISVLYSYEKLSDWVKVQNLLKSIPYIRSLKVDAMSNSKVQFQMEIVGNEDKVWRALRNKGLNLKQFNNFYWLEY